MELDAAVTDGIGSPGKRSLDLGGDDHRTRTYTFILTDSANSVGIVASLVTHCLTYE